MCDAGLLLDKDSKELQELRVQIQDLIKRLISHHQKDLKKKCQTTHACDVDFRMDKPPSEDFRTVFNGKPPSKGAVLNGPVFPKSQRSIAHVAVMMQHVKVVKELVERGADMATEDRMGLTPLHFAHLIQSDPLMAALGDAAQLSPMSSTQNATPQDFRDAAAYAVQSPPILVKVAGKDGKAEALDSLAFLRRMQARFTKTCLFSDEYMQILYSSVLDEEGHELINDPYKQRLTEQYRASTEERRLAIAHASETVGYGVFALEAFAEGDYVCCYAGVVQDVKRCPVASSYVMTVLPIDRFPFKTDATAYRSFGAYINHSDAPNLKVENIVCKGSHLSVFVASRAIAAGEQLSFDYKGRIHSAFCDGGEVLLGDGTFVTRTPSGSFEPLGPLDPRLLADLQKL